jgi:hypothetical protein
MDLLPLYLADEVSQDSRTIVEKYLETDPQLARIARQTTNLSLAEEIPIPLTKETQMEAYKDAKQRMFWRTIIVAALIAFSILALLAFVAIVFLFLAPA